MQGLHAPHTGRRNTRLDSVRQRLPPACGAGTETGLEMGLLYVKSSSATTCLSASPVNGNGNTAPRGPGRHADGPPGGAHTQEL